ncbi:MAG: methanol dehydrogenase [Chloroflexota bacterium]
MWSFHHPARIEQVEGALRAAGRHIPTGGSTLVVTTPGGLRRGWADEVRAGIDGAAAAYGEVASEPDLDDLDRAIERLRPQSFSAIVAVGGGSVLDTAKVLACMLPARGLSLQAVLREGAAYPAESIPTVAIPTTAGSGAEVTPFATVWDRREGRKRSFASTHCLPRVVLLDPALTLSLSESDTLYPALDAISHALESLWNRNRSPLTRAFAVEALRLLSRALAGVLADPGDVRHRAAMQEGSLLAGLAISHTRTALAHSISYPLTLHHGVPHGLACSFTLVALIDRCRALLDAEAGPDLVTSVRSLLDRLALPSRLASYVGADEVTALTGDMLEPERASNFIESADERLVEAVLTESLHR